MSKVGDDYGDDNGDGDDDHQHGDIVAFRAPLMISVTHVIMTTTMADQVEFCAKRLQRM